MAKTLKMNYDDAEIIKNNFYDAQDDLESKKKDFLRVWMEVMEQNTLLK